MMSLCYTFFCGAADDAPQKPAEQLSLRQLARCAEIQVHV